ncbi:hypothetical protein PC121_g5730 [Phytophthora cactorum]|nr:hypothetical protein PC121_g5730 [Phytophthora cactorum]
MQALAHDDIIISSWQKFRAFLEGANFTEAAEEITEGKIESLETAMKQNSSCGRDLKSLIDRDVLIVTNNGMQQIISESSLATAYKTREVLRKTFGAILNDLIKSGKSDNGTSYDENKKKTE